MIAPISHKSGYTYLGPDRATQRQRLLEGSGKTPRMETGVRLAAARPGRGSRNGSAMNSSAGNSSRTNWGYVKSERYFASCPIEILYKATSGGAGRKGANPH
jgi:hypothetical protein